VVTGFSNPDYNSKETGKFDRTTFHAWAKRVNSVTIDSFRANQGRSADLGDGRLQPLLFTHTGRKSGKRITTPIVHLKDGDRFVIMASMGGSPEHPQWYHNIVANPVVMLEVGSELFAARACVAEGAERERLFAAMVEANGAFAELAAGTTRVFPIVVFERITG